MDVDFLFVLMRYFWKEKHAMRLPSHNKWYLLPQSDLKISHKNWIFSKYDIMQIW